MTLKFNSYTKGITDIPYRILRGIKFLLFGRPLSEEWLLYCQNMAEQNHSLAYVMNDLKARNIKKKIQKKVIPTFYEFVKADSEVQNG